MNDSIIISDLHRRRKETPATHKATQESLKER